MIVSRGPWKDSMKWLNAAHSVGILDLNAVVNEVALWNFWSRHSLDPDHGLLNVLAKWKTPGPAVEFLRCLVLKEWKEEKDLLASGVALDSLPHPQCLDECGLLMVHHGPKWKYPRRRCLSPATTWHFPPNRPLDPSIDDSSDFSDLEVMDRD